ncbi:hypothetical protein HDV05_006553 [Chytridiales sp. JEL 0842]|nr:hypothetical protein HDV05_006553 [Chytridiales sp. JEL 0842]
MNKTTSSASRRHERRRTISSGSSVSSFTALAGALALIAAASHSVSASPVVGPASTSNSFSSAPLSYDVPRWDRDSPFDTTVHLANPAQEIKKKPGQMFSVKHNAWLAVTSTRATAENPFNFEFSCTAEKAICDLAQTAFVAAGARVGRSLAISTPITVKALFYSFCRGIDGRSSCDQDPASRLALGRAAPAAYFAGKPKASENKGLAGDQWMFYPQALAKQLSADVPLTFAPEDIIMEFNSDFEFYYASSGRPITRNQTDLEYVVAHELTHGLGFESGWIRYNRLLENIPGIPTIPNARQEVLAPQFDVEGASLASARVTGWQPLNVFDTFTQDNRARTPLAAMANDIFTSYPSRGSAASSFPLPIVDFFRGFYSNDRALTTASAVYRLGTGGSRSISFATKDATTAPIMFIATPSGEFQEGTSMSHADYDLYANTPDFLMIPAVEQWIGFTLEQVIATVSRNVGAGGDVGSLNRGGIYGPQTLKLMQALGWRLAVGDPRGDITVSANGGADVGKPKSSASKTQFGTVGVALMVFVSCFLM